MERRFGMLVNCDDGVLLVQTLQALQACHGVVSVQKLGRADVLLLCIGASVRVATK